MEESTNSDDKRCERLLMFQRAIGQKFTLSYVLPGAPRLIATITGVDWEYMHVCGGSYGNFHVDGCEIYEPGETEKTKE